MLFKIALDGITLDKLKTMLKKYPFKVEDGSDIGIEWRKVSVNTDNDGLVKPEEEYPFPLSQYGVLIIECDLYYRGLTRTYGQTAVYWSKTDVKRGLIYKDWIFRLRIAHEILHHFDKPCHDIEEWFDYDNHKFLKLLWKIGGSGKRYSFFECLCKDIFYDYLYRDINEEEFNKKHDLENRTPRGALKN